MSSNRSRAFKKGIDPEQNRTNRVNISNMLRKNKREENLAKRRHRTDGGVDEEDNNETEVYDEELMEKVQLATLVL